MVLRFHEGCVHRRVDGRIEEYIFMEASDNAVKSWADHVGKLVTSHENPKVARWLIDLRLSGSLPQHSLNDAIENLKTLSGTIGKSLRVAYLVDTQDMLENLLSSLHDIFDVETRAKWFNTKANVDSRSDALVWLMAND